MEIGTGSALIVCCISTSHSAVECSAYWLLALKSPAMATHTAELLTVGFYNVGIQQTALENRKRDIVEGRLRQLTDDIANTFRNHSLDMLAICELGAHLHGLSAERHFPDLDTQTKLMEFITASVNANRVGAKEPDLVLVSGDIPSYAITRKEKTKLQVEDIVRVHNLDKRLGERRERHMVVLNTKWENRPVNVGLCPCPASKPHWEWDVNTRDATMPNILRAVGAKQCGSGVLEPTAWILGGDSNCGSS